MGDGHVLDHGHRGRSRFRHRPNPGECEERSFQGCSQGSNGAASEIVLIGNRLETGHVKTTPYFYENKNRRGGVYELL